MIEFNKNALDMALVPKSAVESLLGAKEASIKLYLYGLIRENAEPEQIMRETNIDKTQLFDAIEDLQKRGLLSISFSNNTEAVYLNKEAKQRAGGESGLYKDAGFNHMLQALFSDRELSYSDYKMFYELLDVYALPRQVVLVLAEYCINKNRTGNRVSMHYIKETAKAWAKEGIDTMDLAQQKIRSISEETGGAREILKSLKINRLPTEQELTLYQKWEKEWGFSFSAIRAATAATTGAQYPTFKYLDGILKNLYSEGKLSSFAVRDHFASTEQMDETIKELLRALASPRLTVSSEYRTKYLRWLEMGFGEKEMAFACAQAVARGAANLDYVDTLLTGWKAKGLLQEDAIKGDLEMQKAKKAKVSKLLETAGIKKRISHADEALYEKFSEKYGFPDEVILFAATCAYGFNAPLKAMDKILSRWKDAGVKTLDAAKKLNDTFKKADGAVARISDIGERAYSEQELDAKIRDPIAEYQKEKMPPSGTSEY